MRDAPTVWSQAKHVDGGSMMVCFLPAMQMKCLTDHNGGSPVAVQYNLIIMADLQTWPSLFMTGTGRHSANDDT
jgi:hypothetical protein